MPELFEFCLHGRVSVDALFMIFLFLCGYRSLLLTAWDTSALLSYELTEESMGDSFWMSETESF